MALCGLSEQVPAGPGVQAAPVHDARLLGPPAERGGPEVVACGCFAVGSWMGSISVAAATSSTGFPAGSGRVADAMD